MYKAIDVHLPEVKLKYKLDHDDKLTEELNAEYEKKG